MKQQIKTLSKETLIYGLSTVTGRFLNFLLVPFYVNVLASTAEYGISTSLYTFIGFMNVVYPLGLEAAFFRYGSRAEGAPYVPEKEKTYFSTPFLFLSLFSLCLSLLIYFYASHLTSPLFHDKSLELPAQKQSLILILQLASGILLIDSLTVLPFAVLRLEHKALQFSLIRLTGIISTLIFNYFFIVHFHLGVKGIFLANISGSLIVLCLLGPTIIQRLEFKINGTVLKKMLPFGLTNVPAYLSSMMVQVIDRPIVQSILGLSALGVYQANYRMGFVMMVLVGLFEYAWRPFFMRQALKGETQAKPLFAKIFTYFMTAVLLSFIFLAWFLPLIVTIPIAGFQLLKPTYWEGLSIIPVILLAYVFQGMYTNFIAGIYIKEKNKCLPWITGTAALVNIATNFILIPIIGMMGAALATLVSYMVMAILVYRVSQKHYPINYEWGRIIRITLIIFGAYIFGLLLTRLYQPTLVQLILMRIIILSCVLIPLIHFSKLKDKSEKIN